MDYYNSRYQDQENEQEEEETISLSDFPLTSDNHDPDETEELCKCQPPLEKTEFFEFSSNPNSTMSHAEDIISCGKLIPFIKQDHFINIDHHVPQKLYGRRSKSESLPELKISGCQSSSKMKMINSRSLDYQKLSRNSSTSSDSPDCNQNNSRRSSRIDGSNIKIPKPRWYILMFGVVKFPTEMDLQDIKNRQVHRTPSKSLFPSFEVMNKGPNHRKSSWGVLKVLSCRDYASVNVTTSLACMPPV